MVYYSNISIEYAMKNGSLFYIYAGDLDISTATKITEHNTSHVRIQSKHAHHCNCIYNRKDDIY